MPDIQYPTDDMSATARNLTTFLEEQWRQHTSLFLTSSGSHAELLHAFAKLIPGGGGQAGALSGALQKYHQQYSECYQALQDLARNIDEAAQAMELFDQQTGQTFR
ncbi:MAG TPA: hypothetical protein VFN35_16835 [Ktedonobacteraceae bacterium]|nr:hypothetical protein [Ktedonobacteraceae bacterium]